MQDRHAILSQISTPAPICASSSFFQLSERKGPLLLPYNKAFCLSLSVAAPYTKSSYLSITLQVPICFNHPNAVFHVMFPIKTIQNKSLRNFQYLINSFQIFFTQKQIRIQISNNHPLCCNFPSVKALNRDNTVYNALNQARQKNTNGH